MSRTFTSARHAVITAFGCMVIGLFVIAPAGAMAAETCMGQPANIVGTAGADNLSGDPTRADVVVLLGGNDTYREDASNDLVCLGAGDDRLQTTVGWSSGDDSVDGGGGDDVIYGFGGNDILLGGDGNDHLTGVDGNDNVFGQAGNDTVIGGTGFDQVQGNGGLSDTCYGEIDFMGCETIFGGG